ncbi:glycoside hydrolase family 32 protein [Qingrenia yutianensis]|uniref:beta-fructofuranosidase n=1 Tax=Qingrenia yutianensis TaxID=2763676 RepID=A0A926IN69_9FIRM|nr:glycoside hydrolase family 32 protein [Qingrenia yutianensis]MBC8596817.1 glycoside hydrolase family 32 protein [Qingrenia yutianensis]
MQKIHFKAPNCWINDPNGFIWYKGRYHLFYQCFPYSAHWGRMHWGHAVSTDLVNWEEKGIALFPSKTDDRSGCFSGSAIEYKDKMYIYYTGVNYTEEDPENINCCIDDTFTAAQLMITSEDGMKFDNITDKKTVIPPIEDKKIGDKNHTRDPKVWRGKDAWYMVLGSTVDKNGRLLFYKSSDLKTWQYLNYCEKDGFGWMWECPDFFEIDGKGVTIFSPMGFFNDGNGYDSVAVCMLSSFDENTGKMELSENYQLFDYGIDLYAPQSTTDEDGNRVVIAWARMPEAVITEKGEWCGMMCIPRIVDIKNNHVYIRPHTNVKNSFVTKLSAPKKSGYMLKTTLKNGESINVGGYVIKRENDKITTDRSEVFNIKGNYRLIAETPVINDGYELEIYVDEHLVEVFINNGEYVISNVVYGLTEEITGKNYDLYSA